MMDPMMFWSDAPKLGQRKKFMSRHVAIDIFVTASCRDTRPGELTKSDMENGPVEIVDLPMKNGDMFHGKMLVHQRISNISKMPKLRFPQIGRCFQVRWMVYNWKSIYKWMMTGGTPMDWKPPNKFTYGSVCFWNMIPLSLRPATSLGH